MQTARSIVRGSSGVGWRVRAERDRWVLWLRGGVQALLSVESASSGSAVRVDLVRPDVKSFVEVHVGASSRGLEALLLEEIAAVAVEGDLLFASAHRNAWAITIRSTMEQLRQRQ